MSDQPKISDDLLQELELGSSAFELIEFSLDRQLADGTRMRGRYGVNVAKVREVIRMPKINPLGSRVPGIVGIFELRGVPIPAVLLNHMLGDAVEPVKGDQQIIVAEFSNKRAGFVVSGTHRIRRVAWQKVLPPSGDDTSFMTGMILLDQDEFLFILDLEKIVAELEKRAGGSSKLTSIGGASHIQEAATRQNAAPVSSNGYTILIVDDSPIILDGLDHALRAKGFSVIRAENGRRALSVLEAADQEGREISLVVTDVEMPQMDGLTLTQNIRQHSSFFGLPIIFHSSLSGQASIDAGASAGADGYVVKNDITSLLRLINKFLKTKIPA